MCLSVRVFMLGASWCDIQPPRDLVALGPFNLSPMRGLFAGVPNYGLFRLFRRLTVQVGVRGLSTACRWF